MIGTKILRFCSILFAVLLKMDCVPLPPDFVLHPIGNWVVEKFEKNQIPDFVSRFGTRMLLAKTLEYQHNLAGPEGSENQREFLRNFTADLRTRDIAEQTSSANEQHYEVDTKFYHLVTISALCEKTINKLE